MIWVHVQDTGLGVPLNEQDAIFDEFRQSERTAVRGYGGMGLGLAITRRLVELHRGKIGVRSSGENGSGATFYFTLPVIDAKTSPPTEAAEHIQPVLILTGQASRAEALKHGLFRQGYRVEVIEIVVAQFEGDFHRHVGSPDQFLVEKSSTPNSASAAIRFQSGG